MLSSSDIAQMMASQNSMFMGQQAFSQQIGLPAMSPMQMGGGHGGHGAPFSYAPTGMLGPSYAGGDRFAGSAMSGMAAGATAAGMGLGVASMFGKMGRLAPLLDPFSGGAAGFARFGMAGAIGGAALPLGLAAAAGSAIGSFVQGGQQQQMIASQLGQHQFFNPQSRTGMGFTRDDAQAIGHQIRAISHVPEMMTSMEELTKLLPKLKSSGMMQGVRDATEFASRFKESIKTIRDVSKVLGTTMEEAAEFFSHSRSVGFLGKQAQLQNVMNAQFTSGVTGMNVGQVMQMQQSGAFIAQQMGARRDLGARAVTNIAQSLGLAQQTGVLKEGALENITGLQGEDAVRAASEKFTGVLANIAKSAAPGRMSIAGMVKFDAMGKAVGIDEDLARQYREGSLSVADLRRRASRLTREQKLSFMTRIDDISMDFAGKTGPGGIANLLEDAAGRLGYGDGSEAVNLLLQRHGGLSASEADVFQSMQSSGGEEQMKRSMEKIRAREARIREKTSPEAIIKRLKTRLHAATTGHIEAAGAKVFTEIGKAYDEFIDDIVGRHIVTLSKEGADNFVKAMGGGMGREEIKKMFAAASGLQRAAPKTGPQGPGTLGKIGLGMMGVAGPFGAMVGGAMLGGDLLFQNRGLVGESDVAAFLRRGSTDTGRTATAQARHLQGLFGTEDLEGTAAAMDRGVGRFRGKDAAAFAIERLTTQIDGFHKMDNQRKLDELRNLATASISRASAAQGVDFQMALQGNAGALRRIGGEEGLEKRLQSMEMSLDEGTSQAAALIRAGLAGRKSFGSGMDLATAAIAAGQGFSQSSQLRVKFGAAANTGAAALTNVHAMKEAMKKASDTLDSLDLKPETKSLLKDKPHLRKAIKLALQEPTVKNAIESGNVGEAVQELAKRGIKVTAQQLETLQDAWYDVKKEGGKVLEAVNTFEKIQQAKDIQVIQKSAGEAAAELSSNIAAGESGGMDMSSVKQLRDSLSSFSQDANEETFTAMQNSVGELTKAISSAKTPAQRRALIAASGKFGAGIQTTLAQGDRLRGRINRKMTSDALATHFGLDLSDEKVSSAFREELNLEKGQEFTLSKKMLDDVQGLAARMKAGGEIAKKGDSVTGHDKDQEIIKTLKSMQQSSAAQVELLAAIATEAGMDSERAASLVSKVRENADAGADGKTAHG